MASAETPLLCLIEGASLAGGKFVVSCIHWECKTKKLS